MARTRIDIARRFAEESIRHICERMFVTPRRGPGETRRLVAELMASGRNFTQIAAALGVSKPTVSYHARQLGVPAESRFKRRYDWGAVQSFYDEGNSITACQLRFGFARKTFMDAVRRGDVVSRPPGAPVETYLVAGRAVNRTHLKGRLLAEGLKSNECERCGISEWRGSPLSLALHHVNGDGRDNRLENLMLLCPNCHSQTENFAGRGRRARATAESERAA
jgi:DNA-binding transcriptional ArsR family regulator